MEMTSDFINNVKKVKRHRIHKINKSLGAYSAYKWLQKHKWVGLNKPIPEHLFFLVIRKVNKILADKLSSGVEINLPDGMGKLELRKYIPCIKYNGDKITTNLPIDWKRTLKLWEEDKDSYLKKKLVRMDAKEGFVIRYNSKRATFKNRSFYKFQVNRDLKRNLCDNILEGNIDAFLFYEE